MSIIIFMIVFEIYQYGMCVFQIVGVPISTFTGIWYPIFGWIINLLSGLYPESGIRYIYNLKIKLYKFFLKFCGFVAPPVAMVKVNKVRRQNSTKAEEVARFQRLFPNPSWLMSGRTSVTKTLFQYSQG